RVALVSHERRRSAPAAPGVFDARVYALSPGNVEFLRRMKAWPSVPAERVAPVHAMRIFGDDGASRLEFDAYRAGVPELAWIVEDSALQDALWAGLDVEICAPAQCEELCVHEKSVSLKLRDGQTLSARLVVGADGANSFVRRAAGIEVAESDYGQTAVVANFRCEKPHANTAFQWFQGGEVLAFLPLPGDQLSMVWSLPRAEAVRIERMEAQPLCHEVEAASRHALGSLELTSSQKAYPLRRLAARKLVGPRVALAGDAGHVIHPLAGQGLNLGLQDARALADMLVARAPVRDPGDLALLRRYARSRAEPILAMGSVVDGLHTLFNAGNPLAARLRNAGLNLTERLPVLKTILMRQAMR
ncbi:MAG: 2-octaprenyl-3-methyl-6-methoxy,4-benzoquinol hydroxylase, partial [Burkholderiales bacterium]|nr:2-octaprenyl-3-methyl-6-methoxy,4-benzoquinol hydroxylase [Burkholderiales bacterium]